MSKTPQEALKYAVFKAGGCAALGRKLGITGAAVNQWDKTPPQHVLAVEELTGVAKELLRPDLYRLPLGATPTTDAPEAPTPCEAAE